MSADHRARRGRRALALTLALAATSPGLGACGSDTPADAGPDLAGADAPAGSTAPAVADATTTTTSPPTTEAPTTGAPTTQPPPARTTSPPSITPTGPAIRTVTSDTPLAVWTLGDSTAQPIGETFEIESHPTGLFRTTNAYKASTGLARPDFFDWPYFLAYLLDSTTASGAPLPEAVLVSMGANDGQPVRPPDGPYADVGSPAWIEEYGRRVDQMLAVLGSRGVRVYWLGQPIARDPAYSATMALLNGVYADVVSRHPNAVYIDTWTYLSDDAGNYTDSLPGPDGAPVVLRNEDGIHLNVAGGTLVARVVLAHLAADYELAG